MDSFLLQKQIRDNASDLQEFCKDIAEWGEEMKQKEKTCEPKKQKGNEESKEKKPKSEKKAAVKMPIQGFDYSTWDKYDVEAECAKLDENDHPRSDTSGDLSDEFDQNYEEQALLQKEKGNQYVKTQKWDDAIKCYTQAIEYYGYDPIFYANRGLCHLKKENFKAAESDCTVALQLDKTYVKAYQRRAAARERLNQLEQAYDDLLKVFDYEPNNKESKAILAKLEKKMKKPANKDQLVEKTDSVQKPKSKFTISRSHMKKSPNTETLKENNFNDENELRMECEDLEENNVAITDWCDTKNVENVYPMLKPAHLRSTKTLKRIKIKETNDIDKEKGKIQSEIINNNHSSINLPIVGENKTLICDNLKIVERQVKETKQTNNQDLNLKEFDKKSCSDNKNEISFAVPQTSVQFLNDWTRTKDFSLRCEYLKKIKPEVLPKIFKHSLESNTFTDIIKTIVDYFNERDIYDYLKALTEVRRFATLIMFMTFEDKKYVTKAMNLLKTSGCVSNQEIEVLIKKYEIE